MDENATENTKPQIVVHQHYINFGSKGLLKLILAPIVLGGIVLTVVKTEGKHEEINWLVPVFSAVTIWAYL
jgi:hypothetical protein